MPFQSTASRSSLRSTTAYMPARRTCFVARVVGKAGMTYTQPCTTNPCQSMIEFPSIKIRYDIPKILLTIGLFP